MSVHNSVKFILGGGEGREEGVYCRFFFPLTLYFVLTFLLAMIRNAINPLLSPLGGLFNFKHIRGGGRGGLTRDGRLI